MSFSKSFSFLCLLCFLLSLQTVHGDDLLYHLCSSFGKFKDNTSYEDNLKKLIDNLYLAAPPTGFAKSSVGQNSSDRVNGLALCRGDVSSSDCRACISNSAIEILNLCPNYKAAIVWYDYCLLKYSNADFFGQVDYKNLFYMSNANSVSDPESFNQKTNELLSSLADRASIDPKLYAVGVLELQGSENLYGLSQCTRDLSRSECKKCLDDAIARLPNCCDGREGGRVVGGSCNIRYEIYPFLNS